MRRHLEVLLFGHHGDLQELRYTADARRIGLDEVHRVVVDQRPMLGDAGEHFARGDRRHQLRREPRVALDVIGIERLLDPDEIELLERPADAFGSGPVPLLVGVDHQRHAAVDGLAHRLHPLQVEHRVGLADLDLEPANP